MQTPENPATPTLDASEALGAAFKFHGRGKLLEAERLYLTVLAVDLDHADALHLLGALRKQQGRLGDALGLYAVLLARGFS